MPTLWQGLVDKQTGELRSVGTVLADDAASRFDVVDLGDAPPDFAVVDWDAPTRTLKPRPAPVLLDRLDDIEVWLQVNTDFQAVWGTLSAARKTQIRTGIRAVLVRALGARRFRQTDERAEVD